MAMLSTAGLLLQSRLEHLRADARDVAVDDFPYARALGTVLQTLPSEERDVREYLLTGDRKELDDALVRRRAAMTDAIGRAAAATGHLPARSERVRALGAAISVWEAELDALVAAAATQPDAGAEVLIGSSHLRREALERDVENELAAADRNVVNDVVDITEDSDGARDLGLLVLAAGLGSLALVGLVTLRRLEVSERARRLEQQLRSEREADQARFAEVLEHAPEPLALLAADATVLFANRACAALFDTDPTGRVLFDVVPPAVRTEAEQGFAEALAAPGQSVGIDVGADTDRGWRQFEVRLTNLLARAGIEAVVVEAHDVTDRHLAAVTLAASEALLRTVFDNSPDPMLLVEAGGANGDCPDGLRLVAGNAAAAARDGAEPAGLCRSDAVLGQCRLALADQRPSTVEHGVDDGFGAVRWYEVRCTPIGLSRLVVTAHDVTQRHLAEENLTYEATHDALTGLVNRTLLRDRLIQALARVRRGGRGGAALLYLDVDHFKQINDTYGHGAGDELLVEVDRRLDGNARAGDTAARVGGDEFVLLVDGVADVAGLDAVMGRLDTALGPPYRLADRSVRVTVSVGATWLDGADTPDTALARADRLMYARKHRQPAGASGAGVA
jgi:diguanylate cyclase (GGDEF)-like protein